MEKLYYLPITKSIDLLSFNKFLKMISIEKQEKINRFYSDIDKKLSIYSELLIRIIVCQIYEVKNKDIVFDREKYGKPCLSGYSDFHFSISHTRNAIVVAISDNPIGVDIERIKEIKIGIVKRFFTECERAYINEDKLGSNKRFYEIWTKKEAYVKYLGLGLSVPLNSFDVLDSKFSDRLFNFEKSEYIISIYSVQCQSKIKVIELNETYIKEMAFLLLQS